MGDRQKYVALFNRDSREYVEKWHGDLYRIPGQKAIKMTRRDAIAFRGEYGGNVEGDSKTPLIKNLVIRELSEIESNLIVSSYEEKISVGNEVFTCNFDGLSFPTQSALDEHLLSHSDKVLKSEDDEKLLKPDDMVTCPFCGKVGLKGAAGLQGHLRSCKAGKAPVIEQSEHSVQNEEEELVS